MFFKKSSTTNIKFSTFDPFLLENLPPAASNKMLPKWFTDTSPVIPTTQLTPHFDPHHGSTIRKCPAINDYFSTGITVPLWSDLEVHVDSKNQILEWKYANVYQDMDMITSHSATQFPQLSSKYLHTKIISPWIAHCNRNVQWFLTRPTYLTSAFDDQDVIFCDGAVQFKNNFNMHVNLFFPIKSSSYNVKFEAGTPFLKLIPLTEHTVNITTEYCTREYYNHASLVGRRIAFSPSVLYNKLIKNIKLKETK
jgi:hypothetical protein